MKQQLCVKLLYLSYDDEKKGSMIPHWNLTIFSKIGWYECNVDWIRSLSVGLSYGMIKLLWVKLQALAGLDIFTWCKLYLRCQFDTILQRLLTWIFSDSSKIYFIEESVKIKQTIFSLEIFFLTNFSMTHIR